MNKIVLQLHNTRTSIPFWGFATIGFELDLMIVHS